MTELNTLISVIWIDKNTCFIPPAGGVACFASGQDLFNGRQTGEINKIGGRGLSIQSHQSDVELHRGHLWVPEALISSI